MSWTRADDWDTHDHTEDITADHSVISSDEFFSDTIFLFKPTSVGSSVMSFEKSKNAQP